MSCKGFVFGKNIIAPTIANKAYARATANAGVSLIIRAAMNVSVKVPRSAPRMKGIAFLRLKRRAIARGTRRPIVMLEENRIAVKKRPRR